MNHHAAFSLEFEKSLQAARGRARSPADARRATPDRRSTRRRRSTTGTTSRTTRATAAPSAGRRSSTTTGSARCHRRTRRRRPSPGGRGPTRGCRRARATATPTASRARPGTSTARPSCAGPRPGVWLLRPNSRERPVAAGPTACSTRGPSRRSRAAPSSRPATPRRPSRRRWSARTQSGSFFFSTAARPGELRGPERSAKRVSGGRGAPPDETPRVSWPGKPTRASSRRHERPHARLRPRERRRPLGRRRGDLRRVGLDDAPRAVPAHRQGPLAQGPRALPRDLRRRRRVRVRLLRGAPASRPHFETPTSDARSAEPRSSGAVESDARGVSPGPSESDARGGAPGPSESDAPS